MMQSKKPRVVYLSSTDMGEELLSWLAKQPCNIVMSETRNQRIGEFPQYDFGLSFLYTHLVPKSEFKVPKKWVNFHPGPLPEYRGRNIAYHAIMLNSSHFGATIHYMDKAFDTGEIIAVERFPIEPAHTAGDIVRLSHKILISLFKMYVPLLLQHGELQSQPQGKGPYFKKTNIDDTIKLSDEQEKVVRSVTVTPRFFATTVIGGRHYKIIPSSDM